MNAFGNAGKPRFLLIYREMIPSVRLCGHCQLETLARWGRLEYRAVQELKLKASDLDWAEVAVLGRLESWYEYRVAQSLKNAGKKILYIIDDDLTCVPPEVGVAAYYARPEIQRYIGKMIDMSDGILSPSPVLLERFATDGKMAIQVGEPSMIPAAYRPREPGRPVKIGFAGSIDRKNDLEDLLREALLEVKAEYGEGVAFEFFGAAPSFAQALNARIIPYCDDYKQYRERLNAAEWDIGLAPMPDTPFHGCKHFIKFCEYAASGIAGVYSRVSPYTRIRGFEGCGVLCDNTVEAWTGALRRLLEDRQYREGIRAVASEYAVQKLSVEAVSEALWPSLDRLIKRRGAPAKGTAPLWLLKACNPFMRFATKIRTEGLRGCIRAAARRVNGRLR